jgi:hypothetical protein
MYVLISFSKNRIARRLDSSIYHFRRNKVAGISVMISRQTDNLHLRASICHAPARFLSAGTVSRWHKISALQQLVRQLQKIARRDIEQFTC